MLKSPYENVYLYCYENRTLYRNDGNGEECYSPVKSEWFQLTGRNEDVFFYRNDTVEVDIELVPYLLQIYDGFTVGWGMAEENEGRDFLAEAKELMKKAKKEEKKNKRKKG